MAYNTVYVWAAYETLGSTNLNANMANLDYLKSKADRRIAVLPVFTPATALEVGDGAGTLTIPADIDSANLVDIDAVVYTVSSSGLPSIQIHNLTGGVDMLSTNLTIDANENSSYTATTPAVINTSNDSVSKGDILRVDVDAIGTGTKGLDIHFAFYLT